MEAPKRCPRCRRDTVRSIDRYLGTCVHRDGEPQGYTQIDWDNHELIGYDCENCDWTIITIPRKERTPWARRTG